MKELADLVAQIPATFWGIIIGSIFTLTATLGSMILTNRGNDRRLRLQLDQDRELKNREREMAMRKDIYLAAAEAASVGMIAVGQFSNLDIPDQKLTEKYLDKSPSIIKVHIIANEDTVRAVINFTSELSGAVLRLFAKRMPLVLQKQHISFLGGQIDTFREQQTRMLELMNQYNLEGRDDPKRWDTIQGIFNFERSRIEETMRSVATLNASLNPQHLQFMEEVFKESITLGRLLTPALISIRKELELPLDEAEFRRISEEAMAKQIESLKAFIEQLRSVIVGQTTTPGDAPAS